MGASKDERRNDELFKGARMKAFPNHRSEGMELRDYFAAKAMQALLSNPDYDREDSVLASSSYNVADAMMKAREQK